VAARQRGCERANIGCYGTSLAGNSRLWPGRQPGAPAARGRDARADSAVWSRSRPGACGGSRENRRADPTSQVGQYPVPVLPGQCHLMRIGGAVAYSAGVAGPQREHWTQQDFMGRDPKGAPRWPGVLCNHGRHTDRTRISPGTEWRIRRSPAIPMG